MRSLQPSQILKGSYDNRGFTLLEVLLTLGLVASLALVIYQTTIVHVGLTESGRRKATRAQFVRGVIGQLQRDMGTVFTGWQAVSRDAASESSQDSMEEEEDEEQDSEDSDSQSTDETAPAADDTAVSATGQPLSEYEVPGGGVLGFEDALTMVVRRTTAGLNFAQDHSPDPTAKPVSDLRLVRYWLGSPGIDTSDTRVGLVRQEIDYVPDVTAGDDPASGAITEIIAEEVRSIAFQYFDGNSWYQEWDQTRESAPMAVQVMIAVARPKIVGSNTVSQNEELEYFRIVVAPSDAETPSDADADNAQRTGSSTSGADSTDSSIGQGSDSPSSTTVPPTTTPQRNPPSGGVVQP